jgi:signal peptidase I
MIALPLKRFLVSAWETAEVVIIALITVVLIRTFIAQPFLVSGASMEQTFHNGNYLLIDELTYRFREPTRGEVIVFKYVSENGEDKEYFIKRIIGLPGETLTIADNQITITTPTGETKTLDENYLGSTTRTFGEKTITLGADELFVMGDNRTNSYDSRNWGPLKREHIVGIARLRLFPFSQLGAISTPQY